MSDEVTRISVATDLDRTPWTDLKPGILHGEVERIGLLRHGTAGGRASAALVVRLDDGTPVIVETTWLALKSVVELLAIGPVAREEVD